MAEMKQCPDCAEQVLLAARKCRYCGYRFDRGNRGRGSTLLDLLGRRTDTREATLPDVLADWGVSLLDGEDIQFFRLVDIDGRNGFLLVTDARLVFFGQHGRSEHARLIEVPLNTISRTRVLRHRGRHGTLELAGPTFEYHIRGCWRGDAKRLAAGLAVSGAAGPSRHPGQRPTR